jgi:hypothetical protein
MSATPARVAPALVAAFLLLAAAPAAADTYTVTNTNDPGAGSLRQAMIDANAHPGADSIVFAAGLKGTISLTQGELSIQSDVSITGPGVLDLTVSGADRSRVFNVSSQPAGRATISGLTISDGRVHGGDGSSAGDAGDNAFGGGILNHGKLTLNNVRLISNRVEGGNGANGKGFPSFDSGGPGGNGVGGGIYSDGTLIIVDSLVAANTAQGGFGGDAPSVVTLHGGEGGSGEGGGIFDQGTLTVENTSVGGNTAGGGEGGNSIPDFSRGRRGGEGDGAGIFFSGVDGRLAGVAVNGNTARGGPGPFGGWAYGGGIRSDLGRGNLVVAKSTVSGNQALGGDGAEEPRPQHVQGGGILSRAGALTVESSTISANSVKGGSKHNDFSTIAGGGIENIDDGDAVLTSSSVTGNRAEVGGGVDNRDDGSRFVISAVTLAGDQANPGGGGEVANFVSNGAAFEDTIVGLPRGDGSSCNNGQLTFSFGYNLDQGSSCGFSKPTDLHSLDPQLGELKQNGGPTKTMAIPRSSPALDQARGSGLFFDQRLLKRPVSFGIQRPTGGDGSDIGAFELQGTSGGRATCGGRAATIKAPNTGVVRGTKRADVIAGTRRADRVSGRRRGDAICGRRGADTLLGQRGPDRIRAGRGNNLIRGGAGSDRIWAPRGHNRIFCGTGFDRVVTNRSSSVAPNCERVHRR